MKKALVLALLGLALAAAPSSASAHEYTRGDSDHPLRLVGYLLHPIGMAAEYVIFRPVHCLVSQPGLCVLFGHEPRESEEHNYFEIE